ncbi:hypothetical protein HanRHA438_Chr17g0791841 [Helianthus annuus]|nr:hypothetical protein HanRHA438_Chr17g0791841 [Helianthus annuus]
MVHDRTVTYGIRDQPITLHFFNELKTLVELKIPPEAIDQYVVCHHVRRNAYFWHRFYPFFRLNKITRLTIRLINELTVTQLGFNLYDFILSSVKRAVSILPSLQ